MILIGDDLVPYGQISFISNIEQINSTKANSTILFNYDEVLLKYAYENELSSAVIIKSIKDAIYCNNLNVKYIISENLAIIDSNDEFEEIAITEIDGIIYRNLIQ